MTNPIITTTEGKTYTTLSAYLKDNREATIAAIRAADREAMESRGLEVQLYVCTDGTFYTHDAVGSDWIEGGDIVSMLYTFDYTTFAPIDEYYADVTNKADTIIADHASDAERAAYAAYLASAEDADEWDKYDWVKKHCPDAISAAEAEAIDYYVGEAGEQYDAIYDAIVEREEA